MSKLFNLCNPNNQALVVPLEYGADEDDTYFGSIGDATAKHVSSLSHADRQLWQELIHTKSGNIFRAEPSLNQHDTDPFALRGKELEQELESMKQKAGKKLDKSMLAAIREAFEAETKRREDSEDAYDRAEMIPYHQMEQYPGMEKHIEIPQTPKDWLMYMGNTRQQFYDAFPEGHPDTPVIMRYVRMLDRDEVNDGWYDFVRQCLIGENVRPYTMRALSHLIDRLEANENDDDECVEDALSEIDQGYRIEYLNEVAKRAQRDHILQLLLFKENEWDRDAKRGFNVYSSIKAFGRVLFESYRDKMKGHHWARYRKIRNRHAPRLIARGVDVNRCSISELVQALKLTRERAIKLWHARPFESLGYVRNKGYIDKNSFADTEEMGNLLSMVEKAAKTAEENLQLSFLSAVANELARKQELQKDKSPEQQQEWRMVWAYYRIIREDLTRMINDQRQKENEQQEDGFRFLEDNRENEASSANGGEPGPQSSEESRTEAQAQIIGDFAPDSNN